MFISGVAIGQWNQICKVKEGSRRTIYKIARAICLGDVTHVYQSGNYIIRYFDLNILIDKSGCANVVWRDSSKPTIAIRESFKKMYDSLYTHNEVLEMASLMHRTSMEEQRRVLAEQRQLRGAKVS